MHRHRGATIGESDNFDATEAAKSLYKAIDGIGTDEITIVDVVASCNNKQRQEIKKEFYNLYKKDLVKEFKSELQIRLSFDFKQLLVSLFYTPDEFIANCLKSSVKGIGTDEKTLVEILLTSNAEEMRQIQEVYFKKFKIRLEDDVADDTSGDFRKFVYPLSRSNRKNGSIVNKQQAQDNAKDIDTTFTQYRGTDIPRFDFIGLCCGESYLQMKETFKEYEKLSGKDITKFIDEEFHGDAAWALKSAVKCATSIPGFLAERLWKSLDGISTNDETLIRIIVGRSEIDLDKIKQEFETRFHKTLESKVKSHTSRHFKQLLLAIIRGNLKEENSSYKDLKTYNTKNV